MSDKLASKKKTEKQHYHGHRERLRKRFAISPETIENHELLELLLGYAIPRGDTKPFAKQLLKATGNRFFELIAHPERLEVEGKKLSEHQITLFKTMQEVMTRALKETMIEKEALDSPEVVGNYLKTLFMGCTIEKFAVIYMNAQHHLLDTQIHAEGTINMAPVYPREIAKRALETHATAVILAHNHPGGHLKPSMDDVRVTRSIATVLNAMNVVVIDHIIVGENDLYSMRREGDI